MTGSTQAGQSIASHAGAALKKAVLELGGSDPYIILEDADLETAVETCVNSRLINGGQSCISAKRFVIVASVFKEFEEEICGQNADAAHGPRCMKVSIWGLWHVMICVPIWIGK